MTQIIQRPPPQKAPRVKAKEYMGYIASLGSEQGAGCIICGAKPCQVCHFRGGEPCPICKGLGEIRGVISQMACGNCTETGYRYGKVPAMKNDRFTWPGCPSCHQYAEDAQHSGSEYAFWRKHSIDILGVMHRLQGIYDSNPLPRALELGTEAILEVRNAID